jgi:glucosamine--fructose-6-phosphate aminotransferase (isomerizing)
MCGIVGYIGASAAKPVLKGLQDLEYRGYDSAGIVYGKKGELTANKQVGRVENLIKEVTDTSSQIAIGHTRWATHGKPTKNNAHPHLSNDETIYIVHNGIIENHQELKNFLISQGFNFYSETDTEVVPNLIQFHLKNLKDFGLAFEKTIQELEGAYSILAISTNDQDTIYAAKLGSPLCFSNSNNHVVVASDQSVIANTAKDVIFLEDNEIAVIKNGSAVIKNIKQDVIVDKQSEEIDHQSTASELGDYAHYMIKEIHEAPQTVSLATAGRINLETNTIKLGGLEPFEDQLNKTERIIVVACGTSYYAGLVGEYLLEEIANIPVEVQLASEFKYRTEPVSQNTIILAVSQSGETADTIAALKKYKEKGLTTLGIVNANGSTISRITDAGVYCHAGIEKSVASTKAFIAQVTVLAMIALKIGKGNFKDYSTVLEQLSDLPNTLKSVFDIEQDIKKIAEKYAEYRDFLFIGRGYEYPVALEGALKLKEISYIHAEGYAAGEMKHGPLAMIDEDFPTFAFAAGAELSEKTASNIQEIKARSGKAIVVTCEPTEQIKKLADELIVIPKVKDQLIPLVEAVVLQLFSYYVALKKGYDIDKPRNLAKSVTVE